MRIQKKKERLGFCPDFHSLLYISAADGWMSWQREDRTRARLGMAHLYLYLYLYLYLDLCVIYG